MLKTIIWPIVKMLLDILWHAFMTNDNFTSSFIIGNFAVVRRCQSKRTRQAFALKIIDKSKCQGKEHMIESEIAILNLVSHPHIIELIEVFDFPDEKYLVTELVPGGDLFDAIASDVRYR